MMKKYEYLLFDADNTLFDFSKAEFLAFRIATESGGIPFSEEIYQKYSEINDSLWKKLETGEINLEFLKLERFRLLLISLGYEESGDSAKKAIFLKDSYIEALGKQTCLIKGAVEICRALSTKYKMYLITNGISNIQRARFDSSELKPFFREMFVSEEIGAAKPSVAYFDHVFSRLGNPSKDKCLVIGDSLTSDCDGAISYGLDICRFNPKGESDQGRRITYTVKKLEELLDIL